MAKRILRCLVGNYAGQLVEYAEDVAKLMLAWGRAEVVENPHVKREPEVADVPKPEGV